MSTSNNINHLSAKMQGILKKKQEKAKMTTGLIQFQLIGIGKPIPGAGMNEFGGPPVTLYKTLSVHPTCTVLDPWAEETEDSRKMIEVSNGKVKKKDANGNVYMADDLVNIDFNDYGIIYIKPNEVVKLARLLFADENRTWKYRDQTVKPLWEEVDAISETADTQAKEALITSRAVEVANLLNFEKSKEYYTALIGPCTNMESKAIKNDLIIWVSKNPRTFMSCNIDPKLKAELKVKDAIAFGYIHYDADAKDWFFKGVTKPLFSTSVGQNPEKALIDFFVDVKEGIKYYEKLSILLDSDSDE